MQIPMFVKINCLELIRLIIYGHLSIVFCTRGIFIIFYGSLMSTFLDIHVVKLKKEDFWKGNLIFRLNRSCHCTRTFYFFGLSSVYITQPFTWLFFKENVVDFAFFQKFKVSLCLEYQTNLDPKGAKRSVKM